MKVIVYLYKSKRYVNMPKEGSWKGGIVFGYDSIEKELVINPDEAQIIKNIFQIYAVLKRLQTI